MNDVRLLAKQIIFAVPGVITFFGMSIACLIEGIAVYRLYPSRPGTDVIAFGTVLIASSIACAISGCVLMREQFHEIKETARKIKK